MITYQNILMYFLTLFDHSLIELADFNNSQRSSHSKIPRHQYTRITFTLEYNSLKSQNIEAQNIYIT